MDVTEVLWHLLTFSMKCHVNVNYRKKRKRLSAIEFLPKKKRVIGRFSGGVT